MVGVEKYIGDFLSIGVLGKTVDLTDRLLPDRDEISIIRKRR